MATSFVMWAQIEASTRFYFLHGWPSERMTLQTKIRALPRFMQRHLLVRSIVALAPKAGQQLILFNGGSRVVADISDSVIRQYFLTGEFEPEFFDIAAPFLANGGTFFDVGANYGFCTFGLVATCGNRHVDWHLFEANEDVCRYLEWSRELHAGANILIEKAIVSNESGFSRFEPGRSMVSPKGKTIVRNLRLDDYCADKKIHSVEFAKFDIEGWEPAAFEGAESSLRKGIFKAIYFEVNPPLLTEHGFAADGGMRLLKECGYRLFYCKAVDKNTSYAPEGVWKSLVVNGTAISLAPVTEFPAGRATDVLALASAHE